MLVPAPDQPGAGVTVLRTGVGSLPSLGVLRGLQALGCRVVGVDADPDAVGFHFSDAHEVIPRADDPTFTAAMLDLCERERVDVILPAVNEELEPLDAARDALAACGTAVVAPVAATVRLCLDKLAAARELERLGLPTPATELPDGPPVPFPVIVKPRWGRGSRGVARADDHDELRYHLDRATEPVVVQAFVAGEELSCDLLADPDGELRMLSVRRRLRVSAGISVAGEVVAPDPVLLWLERLTRELRLTGPACVQCIIDAEGIPQLTDLNPRFGGGVALSLEAGTPLLSGVLAMVRGEEIPRVVGAGVGRRFQRFYGEVYS